MGFIWVYEEVEILRGIFGQREGWDIVCGKPLGMNQSHRPNQGWPITFR